MDGAVRNTTSVIPQQLSYIMFAAYLLCVDGRKRLNLDPSVAADRESWRKLVRVSV